MMYGSYTFGAILQVGVEKMHKESKYVLFLDDDVRLHPGSIGALTAEMEKNPEVWQLAHKSSDKVVLFDRYFFSNILIYLFGFSGLIFVLRTAINVTI